MRQCFLNILEERVFAIPMVTTRAGWEMFVGPVIFIGELRSVSDREVGASTLYAVESYSNDVPDEIVDTLLLDNSISRYGFKSYKPFFKKCLQMSVVEYGDKFELTPYARVTKGIGATPLDTVLFSTGTPEDLGRAVRQCISLCR
ncbi:hypothetical protein [Mesorhizobium sp. AA22]|uniref:hypothetical protein n=1 Tax=Mesorhizobium sp. AA22 TaxID=1854057 RepID=UPI0007ED2864|nr:hypothetical protein [Mesorhizobium sp. AA22]QIA24070.1 hypothetical protein A9K68_021495 [Mesorhizobium sp. AA22]